MRREALACRASVLVVSLSFDCKGGPSLNIIYPSVSGFVLGLWINHEANLFVRELERSGFTANSITKVGS
jgi:hypothetical protein